MLGTIWFDRNTGLMVFIKFSLNDKVGGRKRILIWSIFHRFKSVDRSIFTAIAIIQCLWHGPTWGAYDMVGCAEWRLGTPWAGSTVSELFGLEALVHTDTDSDYHFLHKILRWLGATYWNRESLRAPFFFFFFWNCKYLENTACWKSQEAVRDSWYITWAREGDLDAAALPGSSCAHTAPQCSWSLTLLHLLWSGLKRRFQDPLPSASARQDNMPLYQLPKCT